MKNEAFTLITGASQGFGKAMAMECAKRGMNLVLVALPNSHLNELCNFLEYTYKVSAIPIETDLSTEESCYTLHETIQQRGITIKYLINNAGILSRGFFVDLDTDYFLKQIKINICTPTLLTKLFLADLKKNSPSGILNVSSMASFFYLPKKQVYGGTKAYLLSFSKSLRRELRDDKISVSIVCPGGMNTTPGLTYQNRTGSWGSRQSIMDPEDAAKITIDGMLKGTELIIPGAMNQFFMFLDKILPKPIKDKITTMEIRKFRAGTIYS